jgi:hypothetical protein
MRNLFRLIALVFFVPAMALAQPVVGFAPGAVSGATVPIQITQSVSNAAYSSGSTVGSLMSFAGSVLSPNNYGYLYSIEMVLPDAQTPTLDVVFFNANPAASTITNNSAIVIAAADQAKVVGVMHVSDCTQYGGTVCQGWAPNGSLLTKVPSGQTVYAAIVARNAFTPSNLPSGAPAWIVTLLVVQ